MILCSRWLFPLSHGGVAMHNGNLIEMLKEDATIDIVTLDNKENELFYNKLGIPFHSIKYKQHKTSLLEKYRFLLVMNSLKYFQDHNISFKIDQKLNMIESPLVEFIDINSDGYSFIKSNKLNLFSKKVVIRSHTPWGLLKNDYKKLNIRYQASWYAITREKYCFNNCDFISTPSEDLKKRLIKLYNIEEKKITVLPNVVDTNHFKPMNRKINPNEFVIMHVGRFEIAKGVINLINVFIDIAKENPNIKLLLVGDYRGNAKNLCLAKIKNEDIEDKVIFKGLVPYEELPSIYASSDIVIVPSEIYESFSYTAAQGMACGKAVIASKIGGIPETLNGGKAGLLFEPGSYIDLKKNIELVIKDKNLKKDLEEMARLHIDNSYSFEALKPKYLEYYRNIIK
jgi:glycosyltransferase involved in cell wall biosynthesis